MISTAHQNTATHSARHPKKREETPTRFQYRNQTHPTRATMTPRISSGRPRRPSGFRPNHFSRLLFVQVRRSHSSLVINLLCINVSGRKRVHSNTLLPSSHAMLRAICSTANLDVLYATSPAIPTPFVLFFASVSTSKFQSWFW